VFVGALEIVRLEEWQPGTGFGGVVGTRRRIEGQGDGCTGGTVPASYMQAQHIRGSTSSPNAGWSTRGWWPSPGMSRASADSVR